MTILLSWDKYQNFNHSYLKSLEILMLIPILSNTCEHIVYSYQNYTFILFSIIWSDWHIGHFIFLRISLPSVILLIAWCDTMCPQFSTTFLSIDPNTYLFIGQKKYEWYFFSFPVFIENGKWIGSSLVSGINFKLSTNYCLYFNPT